MCVCMYVYRHMRTESYDLRSLPVVKETFVSMEKAAKEMELTINGNKAKLMALNDPACSNLMHKFRY
jgi:hypothetical protein